MRTLFAALLAVAAAGCAEDGNVEYEVTGSAGRVDIVYQVAGATSTVSTSTPWSFSYDGAPGDFAYLSALNLGDGGSVTATIWVNGDILDQATAFGAYGIATASGGI